MAKITNTLCPILAIGFWKGIYSNNLLPWCNICNMHFSLFMNVISEFIKSKYFLSKKFKLCYKLMPYWRIVQFDFLHLEIQLVVQPNLLRLNRLNEGSLAVNPGSISSLTSDGSKGWRKINQEWTLGQPLDKLL